MSPKEAESQIKDFEAKIRDSEATGLDGNRKNALRKLTLGKLLTAFKKDQIPPELTEAASKNEELSGLIEMARALRSNKRFDPVAFLLIIKEIWDLISDLLDGEDA